MFHVHGRHGEIICHPNTSRQLFTTWSYITDMGCIASSFCTTFIRAAVLNGSAYATALVVWSTSTQRAAPVCMSCLLSMSKSLLGQPSFLPTNWSQIIISRCLRWMVQWTCAQIAATTVWSTSNNQLEGTIGRVADTAHTRSFITRRSHLNLLWIYIALLTPMIYTFFYDKVRRISIQLLESS